MSTGLLGRYLNKETTPSSSALPLNGLFKFGMSSKIIQQLEHRHKKHPEKKQIGPLQWDVNLALRDLFSGVENGSIYIYIYPCAQTAAGFFDLIWFRPSLFAVRFSSPRLGGEKHEKHEKHVDQ